MVISTKLGKRSTGGWKVVRIEEEMRWILVGGASRLTLEKLIGQASHNSEEAEGKK